MMVKEYGIEHMVLGLGRNVYASNFPSAGEAQAYIDERIDSVHEPRIVVRMATSRARAMDMPAQSTPWKVV